MTVVLNGKTNKIICILLLGTHLLFIDTTVVDSQIALVNPSDGPKYFEKIPLLKKINPELKVFVTNGGGGNNKFSMVLGSAANRTRYFTMKIIFRKLLRGKVSKVQME